MATQIKRLSQTPDQLVTFDLEWDDVSMLGTAIICVNNGTKTNPDGTPAPVFGKIWRISDPSVIYQQKFGPGTTRINIPTGVASRLQVQLVNTAFGPRLTGFDWFFEYPAAP